MPSIRAGVTEDIDDVADLLTEVFLADPLMSAIAAAAPAARPALDHLHHLELADGYLRPDTDAPARCRVDIAQDDDGRILGAALWEAPAAPEPAGSSGDSTTPDDEPAGLDRSLLGDAWRLCQVDHALCRAHRPAEPHWYLGMIAVGANARGSGLGGRLLRRGLDRVDSDALPAHLESTTPASRRLYERVGFRQVATLADPALPTYWAMTRPARAA